MIARRTIWLAGALFAILLAHAAQARITAFVIDQARSESPTFGGATFGTAGTFEKLVGTAFGEVDPRDPRNAIIQDIDLAPLNARGMVEYSADFTIVKPVDMKKGNRMLFYNVHNRGNKAGLNTFNLGVTGNNDQFTAGDGFLQKMGYTIIWSGWQPDVLPGNGRMTATVPIARNRDGTSLTGIVRSEIKLGPNSAATPTTLLLSSGHFTLQNHAAYPTVSADNRTPLADGFLPTLTSRKHVDDPRVSIPNTLWFFASACTGGVVVPSATQICLPARFQPGVLYELIYRAKDPTVLALGWAGMRDLISFFKHEEFDDAGTRNPLFLLPEERDVRDRDDGSHGSHGSDDERGFGRGDDGDDEHEGKRERRAGTVAVVEGSSQSGRSIRTFLHLGFNQDEKGRIVFEGAFPHIGVGRLFMNVRFAAPGRAWGFTVDHLYPAYEFPFRYKRTHDPITGQTDGILGGCLDTHTCPKIFHVATALEIWEGRQSLGLTDSLGKRDLDEPGFVRTYILASTEHTTALFVPGTGPARGDCEQQNNPNPQPATLRALWVAFTSWVKDGVQPPPSTVPRIKDRTLVPPAAVRFPSIPGNDYLNVSADGPGLPTRRVAVRFEHKATQLHVLDYGPLFNGLDETGILTREPPLAGTQAYGVLVPQVDPDGNDIAGIRSITLQVPLATYTGWNMGAAGRFEDGLCSLAGSYVPFAYRRADRVAGDPRPSIEERYGTHEGYVDAVRAAAARLVAERFLLADPDLVDDAARLVQQADAGGILR